MERKVTDNENGTKNNEYNQNTKIVYWWNLIVFSSSSHLKQLSDLKQKFDLFSHIDSKLSKKNFLKIV